MVLIYVCFLLGLLFVTSFLITRVKNILFPAVCLKALSSISFILTSFAAMFYMKSPVYAYFIIIGQIFALISDISLDLKYIHFENDSFYTHTGFISFGIGHLFFIVAIISTFSLSWINIILSFAGAIVLAASVYFSRKIMKLDYKNFVIDVIIYAVVIGFIIFLPATLILINGNFSKAILTFFAGIILFCISDLILNQVFFGIDKNTSPYTIANLALYYLSQFIISYSILCLK